LALPGDERCELQQSPLEIRAAVCQLPVKDFEAGNLSIAAGIPRADRGDGMKLKFLFAMVMACVLSLGAFAQQDDSGAKQDAKDAAHSTGQAAKKTGHKIKKGTKKVVHKAAKGTRKGTEKVEDKTQTPP
jgi:hypothetical protein